MTPSPTVDGCRRAILCGLVSGVFFGALFFLIRRDTFLRYLGTCLPLRETYFPTPDGILILFGVPVVAAAAATFLSGHWRATSTLDLSDAPLISMATALGLMVPIWGLAGNAQSDPQLALKVLEYGVILPALTGIPSVVLVLVRRRATIPPFVAPSNGRPAAVMAFAFAGILLLLNSVQPSSYPFPWGADTISQVATTRNLEAGRNPFQDPHFLEERNFFYPPSAYVLAILFSQVTGISVLAFWKFLPGIATAVMLLSILLLARRLGAGSIAICITGLMILAWREAVFVDGAARHLAFSSLASFLLGFVVLSRGERGERKKTVAFTVMLAPSILAMHFAAGVVAFLVLAASLILPRISFIRTDMAPVRHTRANAGLVLLAILLSGGSVLFLGLWTRTGTQPFIVSEVAIGASIPYPYVVFVAFLALPYAVTVLFSSKEMAQAVPAVLASSFGLTVLYFTKVWQLYHKYFVEMAVWGLAILAGLIVAAWRPSRTQKLLMAAVLFGPAFVALEPRADQVADLSLQVQERIESRANAIAAIQNYSGDAVVMVNPDDILNRYVPPLTGRFIFCATNELDATRPFQVVSKPLAMLPRIHERNELCRAFFASPNATNWEAVTARFQVDVVLIQRNALQPATGIETLAFDRSADGYSIYVVRHA